MDPKDSPLSNNRDIPLITVIFSKNRINTSICGCTNNNNDLKWLYCSSIVLAILSESFWLLQ